MNFLRINRTKKIVIIAAVASMATLAAFAENTVITNFYPTPYGRYTTLSTTTNALLATSQGNVGINVATTTALNAKLQVGGAPIGSGVAELNNIFRIGGATEVSGGVNHVHLRTSALSAYGLQLLSDTGDNRGVHVLPTTGQVLIGQPVAAGTHALFVNGTLGFTVGGETGELQLDYQGGNYYCVANYA